MTKRRKEKIESVKILTEVMMTKRRKEKIESAKILTKIERRKGLDCLVSWARNPKMGKIQKVPKTHLKTAQAMARILCLALMKKDALLEWEGMGSIPALGKE